MGLREEKIAEKEAAIAELEKKKNLVHRQGKAAYKQKKRTLNEADKVPLDEEISHYRNEHGRLTEEIKDSQKILDNYKKGIFERPPEGMMKTELRKAWKDHAYMIDYKKPEDIFRSVFDNIAIHRAELIIIQDSQRKMADLYWKRIQNRVIQEQDDTFISTLRHEFDESRPFTSETFLSELGNRLTDDTSPETKYTPQEVVKKLLKHADSGQIIPLRIHCRTIASEEIRLFLKDFWEEVLKQIPASFGPKLLVIIFVERGMTGELDDEPCLTVDKFDCHRLFEIKLGQWTKEHISTWFQSKKAQAPLVMWDVKSNKLIKILEWLQDECEYTHMGMPLHFYNALQGTIIDKVIKEIRE